jgi:uncharacterized RDD family membrane protein YckC
MTHHPTALPFSEEATRVSVRRYLAHVIDLLLYAVLFTVGVIPLALIPEGPVLDAAITIYAVLGLTVGLVLVTVWLHGRDGRSPGKRLFGIRVVDAQGRPPTRGTLVRRSIPLIVEYFYVIALIAMLSSRYRQRFGDRWAHTYVIRNESAVRDVDIGASDAPPN